MMEFSFPLLPYTILVLIFFVCLRFLCINILKCSNALTCSIISFLHHVIVTAYSLIFNPSFTQLVYNGLLFNINSCDHLKHNTPELYYSGIFTVIYLAQDTWFDLLNNPSQNKLLIYHHINGVFLVAYSLIMEHGGYMVYICHVMEFSSIFLSLKNIFKHLEISELYKDINDLSFSISFILVRNYLTLSSLFLVIISFQNNCMNDMILGDKLIIYTALLFVALTAFWCYGIIKKTYSGIRDKLFPKKKKM